jgi:hypothetical protein
MTSHKVGTREEWLAARRELLEAEKEHTRRGDQAVAAQAPVDRGARGDRVHPGPGQLVLDPAWSPPGVLPAELADRGLDLRRDLVGA